jgi:hypothetical protein
MIYPRKPWLHLKGCPTTKAIGWRKKKTERDAGWWLSPTHLKNDGVKVSWDDDIPNRWKNIKIHVPTHQPDHHHIPIVVGILPY